MLNQNLNKIKQIHGLRVRLVKNMTIYSYLYLMCMKTAVNESLEERKDHFTLLSKINNSAHKHIIWHKKRWTDVSFDQYKFLSWYANWELEKYVWQLLRPIYNWNHLLRQLEIQLE